MTYQHPSLDFQIKFLKYIQWLLESSSYTSSYKFALLMSLVNIAIESGVQDDRSYFVSYQQLAEQFIELYWDQTLPYGRDEEDQPNILSQNTGGRAAIITKILDIQKLNTNINKARLSAGDNRWIQLHKDIAKTIRQYPAKHLEPVHD